MDLQTEPIQENKSAPPKPPVVRGARACTVCRAAKMKCVGAEDGQKQCQRCKRANVECVFEKHRRGRKPGSKLSEASKMLRRLEKGLNSAKLKSQSAEASYSSAELRHPSQDPRYSSLPSADSNYGPSNTHFPSNELPPLNLSNYHGTSGYASSASGRPLPIDDDDEDADRNGETMFPEKLIRRENQRNSFFRTILNPEETPSTVNLPNRSNTLPTPQSRVAPIPSGLDDPITAGLITEEDAKLLFDLIFLRLNPFINLFDPALHSVSYVRSKCPFLFTTLIMAGAKFFRPEMYKQCQKLANEFAIRAFAEAWKRVEVVQAFACLTYWKEPDDNRTWTYIGYACRMAVELGLNKYVSSPPPNETDFQLLERRNRERTYLVLFVHDRSLSTQTGRHWMLPEDDLIRHSVTWHEKGGSIIRPEDVIVASFVSLRRIASENTEVFNAYKGAGPGAHHDVNYEVVLRTCNAKLTEWAETWQHEMERAGGEKFHSSFLSFFRLYVRLFLNSFGIQSTMSSNSSLHAHNACCTSAMDSLRIVCEDFASMGMLRYGQESILVMSAYSAVFLLKLLRGSNTCAHINETTAREIHSLIASTADAYDNASSTSAACHARFLRSLVNNDVFKVRRNERERHEIGMPIDPRLGGPTNGHMMQPLAPVYPHQVQQAHEQSFHFPASPHLPAHPQAPAHENVYASFQMKAGIPGSTSIPAAHVNCMPAFPHHASEQDAHYWRHMFIELGFGETSESHGVGSGQNDHRNAPYIDAIHPPQQGHMPFHHVPSLSQPGYGQ